MVFHALHEVALTLLVIYLPPNAEVISESSTRRKVEECMMCTVLLSLNQLHVLAVFLTVVFLVRSCNT
jgi:hypothetical protein